jgi:hypothetical protein
MWWWTQKCSVHLTEGFCIGAWNSKHIGFAVIFKFCWPKAGHCVQFVLTSKNALASISAQTHPWTWWNGSQTYLHSQQQQIEELHHLMCFSFFWLGAVSRFDPKTYWVWSLRKSWSFSAYICIYIILHVCSYAITLFLVTQTCTYRYRASCSPWVYFQADFAKTIGTTICNEVFMLYLHPY